ncbi:MAG: hypothetical protein PHE56_08265 [Bacteroidales bacterium]|jgi:hypothetical protein|nr:hypothetical protein [Bacteroidales bacterium]
MWTIIKKIINKYPYAPLWVLSAICGIGWLVITYFEFVENSNRQISNVDAALSDTRVYRTKSNRLAYENKVLQLSLNEAKQITIPGMEKELNDLRIKLKRVEMYNTTTSITSDIIYSFQFKYDTVIIDDTLVSAFSYSDSFNSISGTIQQNKIKNLKFEIIDSLVQVVHRGKYDKWYDPFLFRKRPLLVTITSKNPKTRFIYNRVVYIKRERWF